MALQMGKSAKDEVPQVVLEAINVFDDAMNGTRAEIVYMDAHWYVQAENDEWHLAVTDEALEATHGVERGGRK
jgi:hypothetical protein